jgi:cytidylate kinase
MSDLHSFAYTNITISGLPGCGSTTLLKGLKEALQFDGWKGFSGGEFMREYAKEKGKVKYTDFFQVKEIPLKISEAVPRGEVMFQGSLF